MHVVGGMDENNVFKHPQPKMGAVVVAAVVVMKLSLPVVTSRQ